MSYIAKPSITKEILQGLIRAYDELDKDDLLHFNSAQSNAHDAAGHWLEQMEDYFMKLERATNGERKEIQK